MLPLKTSLAVSGKFSHVSDLWAQAVTTIGAGNAKSRTRESCTEKIHDLGLGAAKS